MEQEKIKVIVADTQFLITESLKNILEASSQYSVVAIANTKEQLEWQLQKNQVDLLIVDYINIELDIICEFEQFFKPFTDLKILVLVNNLERIDVLHMKNMGIQNILLKDTDKDELFRAISDTLQGRKSYSDPIMEMLLKAKDTKAIPDANALLTIAEKEIVRLIVEGATTKEIAARKYISFHTVMTHRKNIFRKLNINSASELVMYAVKANLVDTIEYHI